VAKRENVIEMSLLEFCVREDPNKKSNRLMVVQDPLKITITNYEKDSETLLLENNPEAEAKENREVHFSKTIYIEKEDFMEDPPSKFFRLTTGKEVRLKGAYIIKAESVLTDSQGNITEVICTYDPKSKSGSGTPESQRKVKGTLHWVSAENSVELEIREYDRLFTHQSPGDFDPSEFSSILNKDSVKIYNGFGEPAIKKTNLNEPVQFQRKGYYVLDPCSSTTNLVFNKTVGLRDSWKK